MAILATNNIQLPVTIADGIWRKAQYGSIVGNLTASEPMKFGKVKKMTFTKDPRAEYVAEGGQKGASDAEFGAINIDPHKVQVTVRFNEEVQWADEDEQLEVLETLSSACGKALGRALDLGVFHGINPLTGTPSAVINQTIASAAKGGTTAKVEVAGKSDLEIEAAQGLVINNDFIGNGIAMDPKFAWTLATQRDTTGRKLYPELKLTMEPSEFSGVKVSVSDTVSGLPEATADTKVRAIVGDWSALKWGVQRNVPIEKILYGDPDGRGDLKRHNQIALRAEIVYGWGIFDKNAFALLTDEA